MKSTIRRARPEDLPEKHKAEHPDYEYTRRDFVPRGTSEHTMVSIYEVQDKERPSGIFRMLHHVETCHSST